MPYRVPDVNALPVETAWSAGSAKHCRAGEGAVTETAVDVSVCIANWNCRDLLRACLKSLTEQFHGVSLEIIVVDNASTDGAAAMVEREFPDVVVIRNDGNRGFSQANNQAAKAARGAYLFFLNNDTEVPPDTVRRMIDYLEAHPTVGMIGPHLRDPQGKTQVSYRQLPTAAALLHRTCLLRWTGLLRGAYRRYRRGGFDPNGTRTVECLMGAAVLMPRHVFLACGGWDEDFSFGGEDLDLSARVGRLHPLVFLPHAEVLHHGRVSTRLNFAYATPSVALGYVRYLRKSGVSSWVLFLYKLVVAIDTPLHLLTKTVQYAYRRLRGRREAAERSLLVARGLWYLLTKGMIALWKA